MAEAHDLHGGALSWLRTPASLAPRLSYENHDGRPWKAGNEYSRWRDLAGRWSRDSISLSECLPARAVTYPVGKRRRRKPDPVGLPRPAGLAPRLFSASGLGSKPDDILR